jgi:nicotinamidase-related amidase
MKTDALLVVDMQEGLLRGAPKHDLPGVVARINRLARRVRQRGGAVVFVQHAGPAGDDFEPRTPGWRLLPALETELTDRIVGKKLNDPFFETSLRSELDALGARRVLVTGWATDLCVDATVRSAAALGFEVIAVADGHTVSDRPHLGAAKVIDHHHWVWANLIAPHQVAMVRAADVYPETDACPAGLDPAAGGAR